MKHKKRHYTAPGIRVVTVMAESLMVTISGGGNASEYGKPTPRSNENSIWDDQWLNDNWGESSSYPSYEEENY